MNHKLKGKLPHIRQEMEDWCIPASIEIALKYLCPKIDVTQKELWDLLDGKPPSFIYSEILSNLPKFDVFSFEHWGPGTTVELKGKLQKAVRSDHPVLLSMPAIFPIGDWHIRVCHTVTGDGLVLYNPGNGRYEVETFDDIESKTKDRNGGDILIIGLKS